MIKKYFNSWSLNAELLAGMRTSRTSDTREMVANILELESEKYEMPECNLLASLFKLKHQQSIGLEKLNRLAKA